MNSKTTKNVLGTALKSCCTNPITGYFRDGFCHTNASDIGAHVVCVRVTTAFLAFSKSKGNDLSTPALAYNFPGLQPGDKWCLCALRWQEAMLAGVAPPVVMESTHIKALEYLDLADLKKHVWIEAAN